MTLLEIFFVLSWIIILILAFKTAKKEKFNALYFVVFLFWGIFLLIFTFSPNFLTEVWKIVWVQRWSDLLVYSSIIFLIYFVLLLLNKHVDNKDSITALVRAIAIENSSKKIIEWKEVFVIPVYNEEKVIKNTIENILDKNYKNIILINDGSIDNTRNILEKISLEHKNIILLNHLKNRWQWASLETWFEYIRKYWKVDYIVTFDADWQHSLKDLKKFYEILDNNKKIDIVFWTRFSHWNTTKIPLSRRIVLKLAILFTFFLSQINLSDTHNWYRVFRSKILDKIKISIDWMWHASEIIDLVSTKKIKFAEVPVEIQYTEYSLSKWVKNSHAFWMAFRIIWRKIFK